MADVEEDSRMPKSWFVLRKIYLKQLKKEGIGNEE